MRRRLALAASSASILSLILAATAFAGGWANAVMDTPPNDPAGPNEPGTLGFTLLQHGETPVDWGSAQIVLTNDETGQQIVGNATPSGPIGHWTADVTLPAEGSWSYQVAHQDLEITIMGAQPINVGGPRAASTGGGAAIGGHNSCAQSSSSWYGSRRYLSRRTRRLRHDRYHPGPGC